MAVAVAVHGHVVHHVDVDDIPAFLLEIVVNALCGGRLWMNWQLKGIVGDSALFMNEEYEKTFYPQWTFERKNW